MEIIHSAFLHLESYGSGIISDPIHFTYDLHKDRQQLMGVLRPQQDKENNTVQASYEETYCLSLKDFREIHFTYAFSVS